MVILSPIFVGLAGWLTTLVARYLPGHPALDSGQLASLFIAGAAFAAAHVALWLHGWQKNEAAARAGPLPGEPLIARTAELAGPKGDPGPPGEPGMSEADVRELVSREVADAFTRAVQRAPSANP